jgi:hypothetical protein
MSLRRQSRGLHTTTTVGALARGRRTEWQRAKDPLGFFQLDARRRFVVHQSRPNLSHEGVQELLCVFVSVCVCFGACSVSP